MKKLTYLLAAILAVSVLGCNGQSERTGNTTGKPVDTSQESTLNKSGNDTGIIPVHLNKTSFLKLVMDYEKNPETWSFLGEKPCVIDFYADWCAPCRITSPILEVLAREYAGRINIYKIDVDKEKELASVFGVQSIPTFLFCPMEGNPTISAGISNSPEATKRMFIQQIEELLLKKKIDSSI